MSTVSEHPRSAARPGAADRCVDWGVTHAYGRLVEHDEPIAFLSQLPAAERAEFERLATHRSYSAGSVIWHAGDDSGGVIALLKGRVKVVSLGPNATEVLLGLPGPGDLIGELSVLEGAPRSATVTAVEPVEALAVSGQLFRQFLSEHPAAAMGLLLALLPRLREADRQRMDLAANDVTGRVASRLVDLAERFGEPDGDGTRIMLSLSQEELASWTGASREAVAKALRALREAQWVTTERRHVTVMDADALRRIAG